MGAEMIERVAKVISHHLRAEPSPNWHDVAREAIEAMREPTQEMMEAGGTNLPLDWNDWRAAKYCYEAMIDAALK